MLGDRGGMAESTIFSIPSIEPIDLNDPPYPRRMPLRFVVYWKQAFQP